ncbi:unnamed protein product, partial [Ectocarpus sp. 6 AP-2014]
WLDLGAQGLEPSPLSPDTAHRVAQLPSICPGCSEDSVVESYFSEKIVNGIVEKHFPNNPARLLSPHGNIWMLWAQRLLSDSDSSY